MGSEQNRVQETHDVFVHVDITDPRARPLFDELSFEYTNRYGDGHSLDFKTSPEMKKYPPILFRPPLGGFVLLLRDGVPIAGGGFMPIDERTAEVKRVWTSATHRRQGLSQRVLQYLEADIARRGYTRIYLTTGNRQPEARNLYLKAGLTPLFDTDAPPESLGLLPFEKVVTPAIVHPAERIGLWDRIIAWRQRRAVARAWTLRHPIPLRLDDALRQRGEIRAAHPAQSDREGATPSAPIDDLYAVPGAG